MQKRKPRSFQFRKNIVQMEGYQPGEQPSTTDYIKLNTNENPYPPSPRVGEALTAELDRLRLYPDPMATKLREKIAELHQVGLENILIGNGSDELLTIAIRTFVDKGDCVASPSPTYTLYKTLCEIQGARYTPVEYREDYSLNESLIPAKAKIVFVSNPNSPSGTILPEESLAKIASSIAGILVVDEAYVDFAKKNCLGLLKKHRNVIILRTFSKSFSLAGLRVGYALADKEIMANFIKVKDSYNVSRFAIVGGLAALNDLAWTRANVKKVLATRRRLIWGLEELGFFVYPSEANFVLARHDAFPADQIYRQLKRKRILVRYYDTPRLKNCLRISVGTDQEIVRLVVQIAEIMGWKGKKLRIIE
ncbi:MAG: histidinol-phosphate transaminase [bacterium]